MTSRCGGKPGEPGLHPALDRDEVGPPLAACPECDRSVPPLGRSAPMEQYQCDHRDVWPTDRSGLWPGERLVDFGYPKCPGCPDCRPCRECEGTGIDPSGTLLHCSCPLGQKMEHEMMNRTGREP